MLLPISMCVSLYSVLGVDSGDDDAELKLGSPGLTAGQLLHPPCMHLSAADDEARAAKKVYSKVNYYK